MYKTSVMNAYLIVYQTDKDISAIRKGLDTMRMTEHISDHSSIVLSFRSAEDVLDVLKPLNTAQIPLIIIKLDSVIHTENIKADFFEPHSVDHL